MNKPFLAILTIASIFAAGCGPANQDIDCGTACRDSVADAPGDVGLDGAGDVVVDVVGEAKADVVGDVPVVIHDASDATGGGASVDIVIVPPLDCLLCNVHDDCGSGYTCQPVGAEKHCLRDCVDDGDCLPGFTCYNSGGGKSCLPVSYSCAACIYETPCLEGRCCDFASGLCKDCRYECQKCTYDYDCDGGMRCRKVEGNTSGFCAPECADGICPDPANQTCTDNGRGVMLCVADKDYCAGRCFPPTPHALEDGTCVECADDQDCSVGEVCDSVDNYCRDASCPKGQLRCDSGQCLQCCVDDDCLEYPEATGYCLPDGTCEGVIQCNGLCTSDFPKCVEVDGVNQCVQCKVDADCALIGPDITCTGDPSYYCVTPDGGIPDLCGSCSAMCTSDLDCPPGSNGAVLSCKVVGGSGICFDPAGSCDGSGACCAPGQKCYDLGELFWELVAPDSDYEMANRQATACSCDEDNPCLGETPCTDISALCKFSFLSGGTANLLETICPDGQLDPAIPQYLCMDTRDFITGLLPALSYSPLLKQGTVNYEQITRVDVDDNGDFSRGLQAERPGQPLRGNGRLRGFGVKRCF